MKYHILSMVLWSWVLCAVTIPKSSLQTVKDDLLVKLQEAEKIQDQTSIKKYQTDLAEIEKKIKKFELEWLHHRKSQLSMQTATPETMKEINEIESLISVR